MEKEINAGFLKKYPWKTTSDIKDRIPLNPHLPVIYKFENLP